MVDYHSRDLEYTRCYVAQTILRPILCSNQIIYCRIEAVFGVHLISPDGDAPARYTCSDLTAEETLQSSG